MRCGDGHAPEHATLWSEDDRLIIGGDQLLPGISANIGVYPTEPDADPLSEWLTSCRRFQPLAQPDQLILPGHKLPFTGLPLRLTQKIASHETALARLLDHLSSPTRAVDCFSALYRRSLGPDDFGLALAETFLCVLLFAACAFHVRWRFQMAKANTSIPTDSETTTPSDLSK